MLVILYFFLACWLAAAMLGALLLCTTALAIAAAALADLSLQAARSLQNLIAAQSLNRSAGGKRPKS